jgi:tRNA(Ile)-lysidine synthase TilS/MesJ
MSERATISGVSIVRPLLRVRGSDLRAYLRSIGQPWREDSSNASPKYQRNVVRQVLQADEALTRRLCELADRCRELREALDGAAPRLGERFACAELIGKPRIVAEHAARRWLIARGCDVNALSQAVCARLVEMATTPSSPLRQHFPGGRLVRRRKGHLSL